MIKSRDYHGFPNCLELSNDVVKLVISTDFGPRILSYSFDGGENILGWHPDAAVETSLGTWKPYGGHRLWRAPENMPLSYAPDNGPVAYEIINESRVSLTQDTDPHSQIQKEITVSLEHTGSRVSLDHRLTNRGDTSIEIAAWALTIMRPGGEVIVPNEPFAPYSPETLLPVRSMTLWSYTDFTDPRWSFEKDCIKLRVDESIDSQQKLGVLNKKGWAAYKRQDTLFVKRFACEEDAVYPDMNSNNEVYTAGGFVEIETLSPLVTLTPGRAVEHAEEWKLHAGVTDFRSLLF